MTKQNPPNRTPNSPLLPKTLRERAEVMLGTTRTDIESMSAAEIQRLIHELQVHQIELEIQNEELREVQIELAESRNRFSDLYDFAPTGYITLNRDGVIIEANLRAAAMIGVDRVNLIQHPFTDFVTRETQDEYYLHTQAVWNSDTKQNCEVMLRLDDGGKLIVQLESVLKSFPREPDFACHMAIIDVTARRIAEDELSRMNMELDQRVSERTADLERANKDLQHEIIRRQSMQELLRREFETSSAILDTTRAIILWLDRDGKIIRFNDHMANLSGYSLEEIQGANWFETFILKDDQARVRELFNNAWNGIATRGNVNPIITKNGRTRLIEWHDARLKDSSGQIIGLLCTGYDITEQTKAHNALRISEERLQTILKTAPEAIITIDTTGTITSFNPMATSMFGYTESEAIGQKINILIPPSYREQHDDYLRRYQETGEARIIGTIHEFSAVRQDGSEFPIELCVSAMNQLGLYTGFIRDITNRKEVEKRLGQADRLNSIGTLAAGLGHDMSNVLLPVRSRLDNIENADLDPSTREQLHEIRKAADYLQALSEGLNLLALDPDDHSASPELTNPSEWWNQTHILLNQALPEHVRFNVSFEPDLPRIQVPPHRLTQAVLNLLINSGSAVNQDGEVELWAKRTSNHNISIGVTDNGCGMSSTVMRNALDPFFTTKKRGMGTGLGLSLVQGVVRSAGGEIHINSVVGKGTTITLEFPIGHEKSDFTPDVVANPVAMVHIRDNRLNTIVKTLLELEGFDIVTNNNVEAENTVQLCIADSYPDVINNLRSKEHRPQQIVILGETPKESDVSVSTVAIDPNDFERLRVVIKKSVQDFSR